MTQTTNHARKNRTLIDELLEDQRRLTAVEKFSQRHDRHEASPREKLYRDLIPLTRPRAGEQFAFAVGLDACSGCKACVTACHNLNGLDEGESWRSVGLLVGRKDRQPFQQTVTTACHHCVEPGCLEGCPVEAYEKDSSTGIVRHLDDQCIGCQYCSWTCPYDVPRYSQERGIVRKCDMCQSRLAAGEAPACAQACPNGAITIEIVTKADMVAAARQTQFLPDSPDPILTIPTTRFISAQPLPSTIKALDSDALRKQPAHVALILMLIATQAAVGIVILDFFQRLFISRDLSSPSSRQNLLVALGFCLFGLFASVLHLGRPSQAWRSFLGWRHSWLSREVIAFGMFATVLSLASAAQFIPSLSPALVLAVVGVSTALALLSVVCSAMVYHATQRDFWKIRLSGLKFCGTAVLLGCAFVATIAAGAGAKSANSFALGLVATSVLKLLWELSFFRHLEVEENTSLKRSARTMRSRLRPITSARFFIGAIGGIFLPLDFVAHRDSTSLFGALILCLSGELLERYLFFVAVAPPRMPGEFRFSSRG